MTKITTPDQLEAWAEEVRLKTDRVVATTDVDHDDDGPISAIVWGPEPLDAPNGLEVWAEHEAPPPPQVANPDADGWVMEEVVVSAVVWDGSSDPRSSGARRSV